MLVCQGDCFFWGKCIQLVHKLLVTSFLSVICSSDYFFFPIFKFDQLVDFEQCHIVPTNASTWQVQWLLNVKSCQSMLVLSYNHA